MRSFASLAAFASIAFATVASALPATGGYTPVLNGISISRRELVEAETAVTDVMNKVNGANGINTGVANAQANQSRQVPNMPTDAYHTELLAVVAQVTGLTHVEILTKALHIEAIDVNDISITALVKLLPLDLQILAVLKTVSPWVKIDSIVHQVDGKTEILNGANLNIASAQATQNTGGYEERDFSSGSTSGAGGVVGIVGAAVASVNKDHATRGEYRTLPDIIIDLDAKIQPLCHDLSATVSAAASASAALDACIPILTEIKTHLLEAKAEIGGLVTAHVDGVLSFKGKELSVHAIAKIYANLCVAVVVVLGLVIKACAAVKTDVLVNLVVDINLALAACISLGAQLAVGLVAELKPFVECVVTIIVDLRLEALIKILEIVVKA